MSILITGGASKIGTHLALLLKDAGREVHFPTIDIVYLLPPPADFESSKVVIPFIDLAVEKGVKRFILLTATQVEKTGNALGLGTIHGYLHDKSLDYVALRPTAFIENLLTNDIHTIRANGAIGNSWPTARIPFVATEDIARVAFDSIVNGKQSPNEFIIFGPEAMTFEQLAAKTSEALGRPVSYVAIPFDQMKQILGTVIKQKNYASIEAGAEDKWLKLSTEEKERTGVAVVIGRVTVKKWLEKNKAAFA